MTDTPRSYADNVNRLHSAIDYLTPIEYETEYYRHSDPAQVPLSGELALH